MSSSNRSRKVVGNPVSADVGDADRGEPELGASREDELAYRLRQQELIAEFGVFALGASVIDEVMHQATRLAAQGMNVDLCKFLEYQDATDDLLVRAGVGWKPGTVGIARLGADFESPAGFAFKTQASVLSNHLDDEDRFRTPQLMRDHDVRRALNVPVLCDGKPYGVLEVDSGNTGKFTTADIAFVRSIANTLSVAIERQARELELARTHEREALLAAEMRHRVKNVLTLVDALIKMSRRDAGSDADAMADVLSGRIIALAAATDAGLVNRAETEPDDGRGIDPVELTRSVVAPYGSRIVIAGEARDVSKIDANLLALAIHELATNAIKYGALSSLDGRVEIEWTTANAKPGFVWREIGGPAIEQVSEMSGFGQQMIDRILRSTGGTVERHWNRDGLEAEIRLG